VIRHPYNKGNGAAVKSGIRTRGGEFVLIIDADGQHPPRMRNASSRRWATTTGDRRARTASTQATSQDARGTHC
jgi:glycosyltransferase involved in cell wall biosynthesis